MSEGVSQGANPVVFLQGFKTILRPPCVEADLDLLYAWINDPEIRCFLKVYRPKTHKAEREWLENVNKANDRMVFVITLLDGRPIGVMSLDQLDWKNRNAMTGTFIGDKSLWGQGYGTDAKMALLKFAFHELGLHKVRSGAIEFNERSVAYSQKCGYQVEGCEREVLYRDGRFYDRVILGVFRSDWEAAYALYAKQF